MDINSAIKGYTEYLSEGPFNTLFTNPVYVAMLITAVIVLIVLTIYSEGRVVKMTFYVACSTLAIVFIHNKLLLIEHRRQLCSKDEQSICSMIGGAVTSGRDGAGGLSYLNGL